MRFPRQSLRNTANKKPLVPVAFALTAIFLAMIFDVRLASAQTYMLLHNFTGGKDGQAPYGGLLMDNRGDLYGTTFRGGAYGVGTVFKLDRTGKETVLHSFTGGKDGQGPYYGTLLQDSAGTLYGTTSGDCSSTFGTVFKITPMGKETVLLRFNKRQGGRCPYGGLIQDADGNLYGTTTYGGSFNDGTVFKLDTRGKETVLYSF